MLESIVVRKGAVPTPICPELIVFIVPNLGCGQGCPIYDSATHTRVIAGFGTISISMTDVSSDGRAV